MKIRKSVFSYIVWAAFAVICCMALASCVEEAGLREKWQWSCPVLVGVVCVCLFLAAAIFFALRAICTKAGTYIRNRKRAEKVFSVILPVFILMGVVLRLALYLFYHTPIDLGDDTFYSQAFVTDEAGSLNFMLHGASQLYLCLLRALFLFFGNTPFAGVVLQIVLFFICLLLLYLSMDFLCGMIPAAVSMAAVGFLPVFLKYIFSLTPELFYLAFYLSGLYFTAILIRRFRWGRLTSPVKYIPVLFLGLFLGFLIYLDIFSISLLFFAAALYSVGEEKREKRQALVCNGIIWISTAAGFALSCAGVCLAEKADFMGLVKAVFDDYFREFYFHLEFYQPDVTLAGSFLVIAFAFCAVPGFLLWKKNQFSAFVLSLVLLYVLSIFSVSDFNYQVMISFFWAALSGIGVYGAFRYPEKEQESVIPVKDGEEEKKIVPKVEKVKKSEKVEKPEEAEKPEKSEKFEEAEKPEKSERFEKVERPEKVENSEQSERFKKVEKSEKSGRPEKIEKPEKSENTRKPGKPAPGEPLPNPLPVPKKGKRGKADFAYQVEEKKMKFDIEIGEDDDFDY